MATDVQAHPLSNMDLGLSRAVDLDPRERELHFQLLHIRRHARNVAMLTQSRGPCGEERRHRRARAYARRGRRSARRVAGPERDRDGPAGVWGLEKAAVEEITVLRGATMTSCSLAWAAAAEGVGEAGRKIWVGARKVLACAVRRISMFSIQRLLASSCSA